PLLSFDQHKRKVGVDERRRDIYIILRASVFQSSSSKPSSNTVRLLVGVFWLSLIVLAYTYSGNITAFLSRPTVEKVPDSLQDILDLDYRIWTQEGFSYTHFMRTSPDDRIQQLASKAEVSNHPLYVPPDHVIKMAVEENVAIIVPNQPGTIMLHADYGIVGSQGVCTLRPVIEPLGYAIRSWGLPRNSPLTTLFNDRILRLHAAGILGSYGKLSKEAGSVVSCLQPIREPSLKAITMDQFGGLFVAWTCGIVLALVVFMLEVIMEYIKERNKRDAKK
ncbi:unnamed protein product, partial [Meganyctiphanes norvegica]